MPETGDIRVIPLRSRDGRVKGHTTIDAADWDRVSSYSWCLAPTGYVVGRVAGRVVYLHRFLLGQECEGFVTDHIDRCRSNNRRSNLRVATPAQNAQNTSKPKNNLTSRFKGVHWNARRNLWQGEVWLARKLMWRGVFEDEAEAAEATRIHRLQIQTYAVD